MKYLLLILSCLSITGYAQYNYKFTGSLPPGQNGNKAYLRIRDYYSSNGFKTVDSAIINNDWVTFSGKISKPCETADFYIKKRGIEFFYFECIVDSGLNQLRVDKIDKDYYENQFHNALMVNSRSNVLNTKLDSVRWYYEKEYPDSKGLKPQTKKLVTQKQFEIIAQFQDEYYSLIVLRWFASLRFDHLDISKAFNLLAPNLRSSPLGIELESLITSELKAINSSKTGNSAIIFSVNTDKGLPFSNQNLSGQPYIIAFSATWCIPCQFYQKKLLSLYHKYKPQGLRVIYFNLDSDVGKWKKHIAANRLDWINVSEKTKFSDSKIAKMFYATAIPLYLVVDKSGKIIYNADEMQDTEYAYLEKYILKSLKN